MLLVVCGMESLKNQAVYWNGSYKSEMTTAYVHPYSSQIDDTYLYYLPNLELRTNKPPNQTRSRVFLVTRKLSKKKQCPNRDACACLEAASFCCRCCCRIWDLQPISVTQRSKTCVFFHSLFQKHQLIQKKTPIYIYIYTYTCIYLHLHVPSYSLLWWYFLPTFTCIPPKEHIFHSGSMRSITLGMVRDPFHG